MDQAGKIKSIWFVKNDINDKTSTGPYTMIACENAVKKLNTLIEMWQERERMNAWLWVSSW